ncbi:hypothetical protein J1N35_025469 [Gossypium stocksii]|uniref:BRCT domain-containing protein n=1 Tax=Gossypium stocksii TaxID=47602 RepID=A0A9D3ZXP9_9ROSI|nr:hypothetical protein J1N35_025469 [Gossypium stocksii]
MATAIHARELTVSASCVYKTRSPTRKQEPFELSDSVLNSPVAELVKKYEDPKPRTHQYVGVTDKPFLGMMISLMGRLSCKHQYWKTKIKKHGGIVSNSIIGVTCSVASPAERERGGSLKLVEAI